MDGVIFRDINFWIELHRKFGTLEQGIKLTDQYLHTNYDKLVEEVVEKLWKGEDAEPYYELVNSLEYLPGVAQMFEHLRDRGYQTAIVSASSIDVARRVQKDYFVDHLFANELIIRDKKVAGEFVWPIGVGKHHKARIIRDLSRDLRVPLSEVIYIGDSDTDIEAFQEVGRSIAFNSSSPALKQVATYVIESENLADCIQYIP